MGCVSQRHAMTVSSGPILERFLVIVPHKPCPSQSHEQHTIQSLKYSAWPGTYRWSLCLHRRALFVHRALNIEGSNGPCHHISSVSGRPAEWPVLQNGTSFLPCLTCCNPYQDCTAVGAQLYLLVTEARCVLTTSSWLSEVTKRS
jgi:hypothetical protein